METYTYNTGFKVKTLLRRNSQKPAQNHFGKQQWQSAIDLMISSDTHSLITKLKFIPRPH